MGILLSTFRLGALWEAFAKQEAQHGTDAPGYMNCRHELLAVGLAAGYYKATGRMQAVLLKP